MTTEKELTLRSTIHVNCIYPIYPTGDLVYNALLAIEAVLTDIEMVGHHEQLMNGNFVETRLDERRLWIDQQCASKKPDLISGQPYESTKVFLSTVYHAPYHGHTRGALHLGLEQYQQDERLEALIIEVADRTAPLNCEATALESRTLMGNFRASCRTTDGRLISLFEYSVEQYPHLEPLLTRIESESETDLVRRIRPNCRIGWLNYWSAELAADMGFDADRLKNGGFYKLQQTARGWYLRLTEEPLDVRRPEHADILLRAYDLLPLVG